jgi:hypothetical protein
MAVLQRRLELPAAGQANPATGEVFANRLAFAGERVIIRLLAVHCRGGTPAVKRNVCRAGAAKVVNVKLKLRDGAI